MDIALTTATGKKSKTVASLADAIFACDFNETLIHQLVTAYLSGARAGTKAQKTRSQVRGGGAKPWRQKGTGRARAGTIRSPLWRGGGVTFAAAPRNYQQKLNKKMYIAGIRSILSELARKDRLVLVDEFSIKEPKTKELVSRLSAMGLNNVLIVTEEFDQNLHLSARNVHNIYVSDVNGINPVSLVRFDHVLMTVKASKRLEDRYK